MTGRSRGAAGAGRGVRQGAGHVARPGARAGVLRVPRARPVRRGAVDRRAEAPAGPDRAVRRKDRVPQGHPQLRRGEHAGRAHQARRGRRRDASRPATRRSLSFADDDAVVVPSAADGSNGRPSKPVDGEVRRAAASSCSTTARWSIAAITSCTNTSNPEVMLGAALLAKQRRREGPDVQAVGEDHDGARARRWSATTTTRPGCGRIWRSWASTWSATAAPPASATPARCPRRSPRPSTTTTCRSPRCCRATATSRAASTPT